MTSIARWRARDNEGGFTLIELMIVVLVILMLAAILIPQFGVAQERARKASCVANQRNIETAVAMWATDNPSRAYTGGTMNGSTPNFSNITGTPQYALINVFTEPNHGGMPDGSDYYLSQGSATGGAANQSAPSYGHVACAYDGVTDPWVNNYDTPGAGTAHDHRRGPAASP